MRLPACVATIVLLVTAYGCHSRPARGIADKRSDFRSFLAMKSDPIRDGLKRVRPYFRRANRTEILAAIDRACAAGRSGNSFFDERTQAGYYVNCNPSNRQLLNGYVPINPSEQPHSRP